MSRVEGLLHGDLYTGCVMSGADETRVVDAEFAPVGPFGYDSGMVIRTIGVARVADPEEIASLAVRVQSKRVAPAAGRLLRTVSGGLHRFDQVLSSPGQASEDSTTPEAMA